jgi:hypothetical protein
LKTGTYYSDLDIRDLPNLVIINADTKEEMEEFTDSGEKFIWIKSDRLTNYKLDVKSEPSGILRKTAKRGLYELGLETLDTIAYLEFLGKFNFKGDSIFILERNWLDLKKSEYSDSVYLFDGIIKRKMKRNHQAL